MPVKFYEWGLLSGGANADGSHVTPDGGSSGEGGTDYGTPESFTGQTDGVGVTTLTFSAATKRVRIANVSDQYTMQYSFDAISWMNMQSYQIVQENAEVTTLYLQSYTAGTLVNYEVTGILQ